MHLESLEERRLLAADLHNAAEPEDVNADGLVRVSDVLVLVDQMESARRGAPGQTGVFTDVNGDQATRPSDLLHVVDRFVRGGESTVPLENRIARLQEAIDNDALPEHIDPERAAALLDRLQTRLENRLGSDTDGANADEEAPPPADPAGEAEGNSENGGDPSGEGSGDNDGADGEAGEHHHRNPFERLDANEDGSLTEDEVPAPLWDRIVNADENEDGAVTPEELQQYREAEAAQRRAELFAERDENSDGVLTADEVDSEHKWEHLLTHDADESGDISFPEFEAALADRPHHHRPPSHNPFERFDENEDGALSEDEVPADLWEHLVNADANEDGSVTPDELAAYREEQLRERLAEHFNARDENEDGELTEDEVGGVAWRILSRFDADESGGVSLDEFVAALRERPHHPPRPNFDNPFDMLDANEDGALTEDEVPAALWERISQADGNNDGAVTMEELQAARDAHREELVDRAFAALDRNDDGAVTAADVAPFVWRHLMRLDANEDGSISAEEFQAGAARFAGRGR
ncbi:MAG: dockerin type I domain-containing protein [Pirellulaceae bacterium]|nr:dockerin type I domain-containing protein [Pirellulaceae bacterium]MDP7017985.1 dockerin type I domain-containing protein [Pirellulaceae bacterium]